MSNLLVDVVPTSVKIEGIEYLINSDFRYSILFTLLMQDSNIEDNKKAEQILNIYYPIIPPQKDEAIEKIMWFYRGGKEIKQGKGKGKRNNKISYSYDQDDELIFAAFLAQYRIDLTEIEYLHWWKFKALFNSLHDDNKICEVMSIRNKDLSKIKDKEERKYYKEMQEYYKIEEETTEDDLKALEEWNNIL